MGLLQKAGLHSGNIGIWNPATLISLWKGMGTGSSRKRIIIDQEKAKTKTKRSSHLTNRSNSSTYAQRIVDIDIDGGISHRVLLELNAHALDQISSNFGVLK
ncbi:hypothetical protein OROHE_020043 [Orobanche hederae]